MKWYCVALTSDIDPGEGKTVEPVPGKPIALLNNAGTFQTIDNICPHKGGMLSDGKITKDNCVVCPLHQWTFDLTTGKNIRNPACKLNIYPVRIQGEEIWISV